MQTTDTNDEIIECVFTLAEQVADLQRDINRLLANAKLPVTHIPNPAVFAPNCDADVPTARVLPFRPR